MKIRSITYFCNPKYPLDEKVLQKAGMFLGEAPLAQQFSRELFEEGVFAMAIGFPTVAKGKARIRVMISAAHDNDDLGKGLEAFAKVGRKLGVIE